ncbi:hypothetical protein [Neolewinella sp.]|uniref:hypothetical protein n=1 Tax=Neolewinella sp. TaxID=2993543 RepID=UPI003B51FC93
MKQILLLLLVASTLQLSAAVVSPALYVADDVAILVDGEEVLLRAGTPVVCEAGQSYTSRELTAGQSISVRVKFNVVSKKQTLISAGALGSATVSDIRKRGIFGRAGSMELSIQSVQAVDGQQVLLSGIPLRIEGKSNSTIAWIASIVLFLTTFIGGAVGFLIKGKEAEFRAGTQLNASVASDLEIEVDAEN